MKSVTIRILPVALFLAAVALQSPVPALARVIDGIVASVDEEPVTFSEVRDAVAESMGVPAGDADSYLREEKDPARILHWIDPLVESLLVRRELKTAGMSVEKDEIDRAVASVRKNNNMTEAEFEQALSREGITAGAYRRRIQWQMERGNIIRLKKMKEVSVSEEEVRAYFAENAERFNEGGEVRLSTLLIPFPEGDGTSAERAVPVRVAAQQAADSLRAGRTLKEIAERLAATHPGTRVIESDFMKTEDLSPEMVREVRRLRSGKTSQPFQAEDGARVVTVLARRGGTRPEFSALKETLSDELTDQRSEKAYSDLLAELKKSASIDVRL
jgi:peptidyl-prolyl cis-trans isomerase SurA